MSDIEFQQQLLAWHDANARDLPWRGERDPYRIWVSEIMLQQTRAEAVKPYYAAFLAEFPDVFALARAPLDAVYKRWEGLGYYSRARNLWAAARLVASEHAGRLPESGERLMALPGVGAYAAGAIASIAFGERVPALDGNQARVLARVFRFEEELKTPQALRAIALPLVPADRPGDYNQALMGLGALLCLPRRPRCEQCPVNAMCLARAAGIQEQLPVKPEKRARRIERRAVAVVFCKDRVWVRRRPERGLLANLYEFPHFEGAMSAEAVLECLSENDLDARYLRELTAKTHIFTHVVWELRGFAFEVGAAPEGLLFADADALERMAFSSAMQPWLEWAKKRLRSEL